MYTHLRHATVVTHNAVLATKEETSEKESGRKMQPISMIEQIAFSDEKYSRLREIIIQQVTSIVNISLIFL